MLPVSQQVLSLPCRGSVGLQDATMWRFGPESPHLVLKHWQEMFFCRAFELTQWLCGLLSPQLRSALVCGEEIFHSWIKETNVEHPLEGAEQSQLAPTTRSRTEHLFRQVLKFKPTSLVLRHLGMNAWNSIVGVLEVRVRRKEQKRKDGWGEKILFFKRQIDYCSCLQVFIYLSSVNLLQKLIFNIHYIF